MFTNAHTNRYRIYRDEETGKTVAVASFAGRAVRGIAKFNPNDTFDPAIGEQLAILRCAQKINVKRVVNAERKLADAKKALEDAQKHYEYMEQYLRDADEETIVISNNLEKLLNSIH
jgi:hypothetical protein